MYMIHVKVELIHHKLIYLNCQVCVHSAADSQIRPIFFFTISAALQENHRFALWCQEVKVSHFPIALKVKSDCSLTDRLR